MFEGYKKPYLWLIRVIGVIGAAPFARRLAAGMGSRVALARGAVGRVGQAQLENQTRSAAAQPGRVLGCAAVTTEKTGGRDVSRLAFWRADDAQAQNPHDCGRAIALLGHRREHGILQPD